MRRGRAWAWPMIVRTAVLDELILRTIERQGVDTVLNLAAGLDARPYRLPLPSALRWVEADFPDVIAYKQEQLRGERPVCVLEHAGIDLTDGARRRALFGRIGAAARQVLVVSEDRKSTRLNSSHDQISYAVFCLKKKKNPQS